MWRGVSTFCTWTKPLELVTAPTTQLVQTGPVICACLEISKRKLTTFEALGEAPFCSRIFTILRWPINDATCKGVRPDCSKKEHQTLTRRIADINFVFLSLCLPQSLPLMMQSVSEGDPSHASGSFYKRYAKEWSHSEKKQQKSN